MFLFTNRAKTQLARNVGVNDTTLTLMSGGGALFPAPSGSDELFPLTLASANNPDNYEITYCIARNGDVLTVQRGQEGTTARSFMSGDVASLNATATTYRRLAQAGHLGTFSPEVAATQGGYKRGAIVNDDSIATTYWVNLQDGNTTRPGSDNPTWQALYMANFVSGSGNVPSDVSVTGLCIGINGTVPVAKDNTGKLWFLASTDALSAEISRAQSAESQLQNSLNAETQRAEAAEAGLQPKGPYLVGSKNASEDVPALGVCIGFQGTIPVIKDSNEVIWSLATRAYVDAETQRAQAAEAGLQPKGAYVLGSGNVPSDVPVVGLCIGENGTVPVIKDSTGKLWFLASTDALSAETNRAQAAEAQAVSGTYGLIAGTHRAKAMIEGTDGNMAVCVDHGGDVWKYLPTVEALNAESQRAQSAEAALQPKGNYVVGDGNVPSDTPVQEMCIGINGTVPVIRDAKEKLWFMATKDDLNSKLDMAGASQPMKVQSFIATTDNGFTVSFPQAFGGPPTSININAMEADWDVGPQAGTWTATSFRMTQYSSNTKGSPQQVSIMAIGPA